MNSEQSPATPYRCLSAAEMATGCLAPADMALLRRYVTPTGLSNPPPADEREALGLALARLERTLSALRVKAHGAVLSEQRETAARLAAALLDEPTRPSN